MLIDDYYYPKGSTDINLIVRATSNLPELLALYILAPELPVLVYLDYLQNKPEVVKAYPDTLADEVKSTVTELITTCQLSPKHIDRIVKQIHQKMLDLVEKNLAHTDYNSI